MANPVPSDFSKYKRVFSVPGSMFPLPEKVTLILPKPVLVTLLIEQVFAVREIVGVAVGVGVGVGVEVGVGVGVEVEQG